MLALLFPVLLCCSSCSLFDLPCWCGQAPARFLVRHVAVVLAPTRFLDLPCCCGVYPARFLICRVALVKLLLVFVDRPCCSGACPARFLIFRAAVVKLLWVRYGTLLALLALLAMLVQRAQPTQTAHPTNPSTSPATFAPPSPIVPSAAPARPALCDVLDPHVLPVLLSCAICSNICFGLGVARRRSNMMFPNCFRSGERHAVIVVCLIIIGKPLSFFMQFNLAVPAARLTSLFCWAPGKNHTFLLFVGSHELHRWRQEEGSPRRRGVFRREIKQVLRCRGGGACGRGYPASGDCSRRELHLRGMRVRTRVALCVCVCVCV